MDHPATDTEPPSALSCEKLSIEAFQNERAAWNDLLLSSERPIPFMTHQWICRWMEHFGKQQEFFAIVLRDAKGIAAAVPIVVRDARLLAGTYRVAEIVGTGPVPTRGMGLADKADILVRADAPAGTRQQLLGVLVEDRKDVDLLDIRGIDLQSPTGVSLRQLVSSRKATREFVRSSSPYLELKGTWQDYLATRSKKFPKNLRRSQRQLEGKGDVRITRLDHDAALPRALTNIFAVSGRSWTAARGTNLFCSSELRAFFSDVIEDHAEAGWIQLQLVELDGQPIAYELCFDIAGRLFAYNASYDEAFRDYSPGTLASAAIVEWAFESGRVEYDLLRGDEDYKSRWTTKERTEVQFLLPSGTRRSVFYATLGPYLKARLKQSEWLVGQIDKLNGLRAKVRYRR